MDVVASPGADSLLKICRRRMRRLARPGTAKNNPNEIEEASKTLRGATFSYISLEERVPQAYPLRKLRAVVDALLAMHEPRNSCAACTPGPPLAAAGDCSAPCCCRSCVFPSALSASWSKRSTTSCYPAGSCACASKTRSGSTPPSAPAASACSTQTSPAYFLSAPSSAPDEPNSPASSTSVSTARTWRHGPHKRAASAEVTTTSRRHRRNPVVDFKGQPRCNDTPGLPGYYFFKIHDLGAYDEHFFNRPAKPVVCAAMRKLNHLIPGLSRGNPLMQSLL